MQIINDKQEKINEKKNNLLKLKEKSIKMMIFENKKIPEIWSNQKNIKSIMNKIFQDKQLKKISSDNTKNNQLLYEYNKKLKNENDKNREQNKMNIYEYNFGYDKTLVSFLKWQKTERIRLHSKINKNKLFKSLSTVELNNNKNNKMKYNFKKRLKISISENKINVLSDNINNMKYNNNIIKSYKEKIDDKISYNKNNYFNNIKTINNNYYIHNMTNEKNKSNTILKNNTINQLY